MKSKEIQTLSEELKTLQLNPNTFSMDGEMFRGDWLDLWKRHQSCGTDKKFRIWLIDLRLKIYNQN